MKSQEKKGLPPGELTHTGKRYVDNVSINSITYNLDEFSKKENISISDIDNKNKNRISWIDVVGVHDSKIISSLGNFFSLHPLLLEDVMHTSQRPKLEEYDNCLFFTLKMIYFNAENRLITEQISIVLGDNYVITFQEQPGDVFDPIRDRLKNSKGRIRQMKADYLLFCLLDIIVDNYFVFLDKNAEKLDSIEEPLLYSPSPEILNEIYRLKRENINLRKAVWPLREMVNKLSNNDTVFISEKMGVYLRDLYDHTISVIDIVESNRDVISGMTDLYMSSVSNRMNEVMKVLTMISTIFIPLGFLAGLYGMNFKYMPELEWPFSYPVLVSIMLILAGSMIFYFKRKKWL